MANPKLLQAILSRLGGGTSTKPTGLSDVIPKPATKPVPRKGSIGPGPETFIESAETLEEKGLNQFQRAFIEEAEVTPPEGISPRGKVAISKTEGKSRSRQKREAEFLKERTIDVNAFDAPAQVFEDVPPLQPDIRQARRVRPTTAIEMRGREARVEARETNLPSEVDETANRIFDQIQDLEDALSLPASSSQVDRRSLGVSKKLLQNFKREAAQTAAEARKTDNPALLQAILDRLFK